MNYISTFILLHKYSKYFRINGDDRNLSAILKIPPNKKLLILNEQIKTNINIWVNTVWYSDYRWNNVLQGLTISYIINSYSI